MFWENVDNSKLNAAIFALGRLCDALFFFFFPLRLTVELVCFFPACWLPE